MWVKLGDAQLTATTSRHQRSSTPWARVSTRAAATSLLHRSCASAGPTSCRCRRPRSRAAIDARCAEGGASLLTSARKTLSVSMRLRRLSIPPVLTRHELRPESTARPGLVGDGAGSRFGWMGIERGRWGRGRDRGGRSSVVARSMPAPSVDGCTDQSPGVAAAGRVWSRRWRAREGELIVLRELVAAGQSRCVAKTLMIATVGPESGESAVALSVFEAMSRRVGRVAAFRPVVRVDGEDPVLETCHRLDRAGRKHAGASRPRHVGDVTSRPRCQRGSNTRPAADSGAARPQPATHRVLSAPASHRRRRRPARGRRVVVHAPVGR